MPAFMGNLGSHLTSEITISLLLKLRRKQCQSLTLPKTRPKTIGEGFWRQLAWVGAHHAWDLSEVSSLHCEVLASLSDVGEYRASHKMGNNVLQVTQPMEGELRGPRSI